MNLRSTKKAWEILVVISKHNRQSQLVTIERALEEFAKQQNIDVSGCKGYSI